MQIFMFVSVSVSIIMRVLITISNTRSKRVNENITRPENNYVCMQSFMFVGVSVIEILLFYRKKKKKQKKKKMKNMVTL